jgi:hypothetical protein
MTTESQNSTTAAPAQQTVTTAIFQIGQRVDFLPIDSHPHQQGAACR